MAFLSLWHLFFFLVASGRLLSEQSDELILILILITARWRGEKGRLALVLAVVLFPFFTFYILYFIFYFMK